MEFITSFKTTLPLDCNAPYIHLKKKYNEPIKIKFKRNNELVYSKVSFGEEVISPKISQFFSTWEIVVEDMENNIIFYENNFNLNGKKVFIKIDSKALGDTIAWMGYIDIFRKKHNCELFCSSFHNILFIESYPDIIFLPPNTNIEDIHTQIYIGVSDKYSYCPIKTDGSNLQNVASSILDLTPVKNLKPLITFEKSDILKQNNYFCLSLSSSFDLKNYGDDDYWTYIISKFDEDVYILGDVDLSKYVKLKSLPNVKTNFIGYLPYNDLLNIINFSKLFIGFSSGLSWLAWALNKKVILISTVTPIFHEPSDLIRLGDESLKKIDYTNKYYISKNLVIDKIKSQL